jgi:hypothetical protein
MTTRKPKFDEVIKGVRVRVYATRSEYEVVFNDDDVDDPNVLVWCYPKMGPPNIWADQARLEYKPDGA